MPGKRPQLEPAQGRAGARWQRAVITGASSGIGAAFADLLARAGADLVLVGRDVAALETVATRTRRGGVRVDVVAVDLSDPAGVAKVAALIKNADPMIDLLVNNAGVGPAGAFVDLTAEQINDTMHVNNYAVVLLTHAALRRMVEADRGAVVHIASAAVAPAANHSVYVASKSFVSVFGQSLSRELAGTNVTCTTVLPGYTKTNFFDRNRLEVQIAQHRWVGAEEVARQALDAVAGKRNLIVTGPSQGALGRLVVTGQRLASHRIGRPASLAVRAIRRRRRAPV